MVIKTTIWWRCSKCDREQEHDFEPRFTPTIKKTQCMHCRLPVTIDVGVALVEEDDADRTKSVG